MLISDVTNVIVVSKKDILDLCSLITLLIIAETHVQISEMKNLTC